MTRKNLWQFELTVSYDGGIDAAKDNLVAQAARKYGGRDRASGCALFGKYTRNTLLGFHDKSNRTRARAFLAAASQDLRFKDGEA